MGAEKDSVCGRNGLGGGAVLRVRLGDSVADARQRVPTTSWKRRGSEMLTGKERSTLHQLTKAPGMDGETVANTTAKAR